MDGNSSLLLFILPAFLLGALMSGLLVRHLMRKDLAFRTAGHASKADSLRAELEKQAEQASHLQQELETLQATLKQGREETNLQALKLAEQGIMLKRIPDLQTELMQVTEQKGLLRDQLEKERLLTLSQTKDLENEQVKYKQRLDDEVEARQKLNNEFKVLAGQILERNSEKFMQQNRESLTGLVQPLREHLQKFQENVQQSRVEDAEKRSVLLQELKNISALGLKMNTQAEQLTNALRSDAKTQGDWGEMILESLLEKSGLRKDQEFEVQKQLSTTDGTRVRPDVLVRLPENRVVVIDAKVSLTAYTEHTNATSEAAAEAALKKHIASLRRHISELASRNYTDLVGERTLDYVLMFVPIESALSKALDRSGDLFQHALNNRIGLVTPNLLMLALRIIESHWRVERQNQNAKKIADRAGRLYDKFVLLVESMTQLGVDLERTKKQHEVAMGRLSTGKGNLLAQTEALKQLGANATKSLPEHLVSDEDEVAGDSAVSVLQATTVKNETP